MLNSTPNEVRFLLDENLSPNIIPRLWEVGVDALHIRDRALLQISDHRILQYAELESRAVATINESDFERLVMKKSTHHGVIIVPSGGSRDEQYKQLAEVAEYLRKSPNAMLAARDRIISIDEEMRISARMACTQEVPAVAVVHPSSA
jgi:predicted nuclease of predicted toxin-antitoxin system